MARKKILNKLILKKKYIKTYFYNFILKKGKKSVSETLFKEFLLFIQKSFKKDLKLILNILLYKNISIFSLKTIKKKLKKKTYNFIPFFIDNKRLRLVFSIKFLIKEGKKKKKSFLFSLKNLFLKLVEKKNSKIQLIQDIHMLSFIQKKFFHYRWF